MPFKSEKERKQFNKVIKDPKVYEALKADGMSKSRAAAISNAQARKKKT